MVPANDFRDKFDESLDPRQGELWHLRESGLVHTVQLDRDTTVVTLTKEGRDLLESRRQDGDAPDRQAFYDGIHKPRELTHDAQVYRAYLEEAEHLREEGAHIHRVVLDDELKREYQQFLQERNRDQEDSDGRPDRDIEEVQAWAREHNLPCDEEGHVQFPDVRIEYDVDGRDDTRDVEVLTPHYRGGHAAAKSSAGFACYRGGSARLRRVLEDAVAADGRSGEDQTRRGVAAMTFQERTQAVARIGFTDRQARFLVTVMQHSGVCVPRQYARFARIAYGQKTQKFFAKLVRLGYASPHDCRHNRARLYHVHARTLYRAIDDPESRLRRPLTLGHAVLRLMALDAIVEDPDLVWPGDGRGEGRAPDNPDAD